MNLENISLLMNKQIYNFYLNTHLNLTQSNNSLSILGLCLKNLLNLKSVFLRMIANLDLMNRAKWIILLLSL